VSFEACSCFLLRCDGCGEPLREDFCELHYTTPDPADRELVEQAESFGWTTDGSRWHCERCPELRSPVCRACRQGFHSLCEDPDCACTLPAGQEVLPGIGEAAGG
jgi:hypothetical protein